MLSWIDDYPLQRILQVQPTPLEPVVYLQATTGSRPNIVARPSEASLNFVVVDAPKAGLPRVRPHYAILPSSERPMQKRELHLLAIDEANQQVFFEESVMPRPRHVIGIREKRNKSRALMLPGSEYSLKVCPSTRKKHCECGCITQDQRVSLEKGWGTLFKITDTTAR
ncbi:hypothetical protein VTN96DRAFT_1831 [Rasamsonia emersonii]